MRNIIIVYFQLLLVCACSTDNKDALLRSYLRDQMGLSSSQLPTAIFVITEEGCPTCDKLFADLVRPRTDTPSSLFLVRAEGSTVDLSGYLEETDQIRFDYDWSFKRLGIIKGSGVVLLNEGRIDTVVEIQASNISHQLAYMTSLLDSLSAISTP